MDTLNRSNSALESGLGVVEQLDALCKPFLKYIGATNLIYANFNKFGEQLDVSSHEGWLKYYFENRQQLDISIVEHMWLAEEGKINYWLWPKPTGSKEDVFSALDSHNLCNGLSVFKKEKDTLSIWAFSTEQENTGIINEYINNLDLISDFTKFFSAAGKSILDGCLYTKMVSSEIKRLKELYDPSDWEIPNLSEHDFL
ncbi:MAG: hypothetical protein HOI80_03925, partial [Alphaproteobacteria bacterium]|nr:hypothetical protein [Alphaproteobacteria bacterium]